MNKLLLCQALFTPDCSLAATVVLLFVDYIPIPHYHL